MGQGDNDRGVTSGQDGVVEPIDTSEPEPLFKWETMKEVGPHALHYQDRAVPGKIVEVQLTSGDQVRVWRADNGQEYFCHGLKTMGEPMTKTVAPRETGAALACRLRHRPGGRRVSPAAGEVEIENLSAEEIEIEVTMHPLQYLNVVITDAAGDLVPTAPYGHLFSPREIPYVLRLAPREKYTHNVSLLGTVPEERQLPGTYTVRAVYEYHGLKAVSEPLRVQLPAKKG